MTADEDVLSVIDFFAGSMRDCVRLDDESEVSAGHVDVIKSLVSESNGVMNELLMTRDD